MKRVLRKTGWMRGWALVVILMIAAGLACSVDVSTTNLKDATLTSDPDGQTRARSYTPGSTFYIAVRLNDAPDEATVRAVWRITEPDEEQTVPPGTEIGAAEVTQKDGLVVLALAPADPWPLGRYEVDIYLNGRVKDTLRFRVKPE